MVRPQSGSAVVGGRWLVVGGWKAEGGVVGGWWLVLACVAVVVLVGVAVVVVESRDGAIATGEATGGLSVPLYPPRFLTHRDRRHHVTSGRCYFIDTDG